MIAYPLDVAGLQTRVLEAGQGDQVVVFVHGTGGRADRWVHNVDAVAAAGYHVYAIDLPGHGFASKGAGVACSVPAYRDFVLAFMDRLDIAKASIVGTSLGGHVVASLAVQHPARVERVALVGSMGLVPIGDEARGRIQAAANNQTREGTATKMARVIHDPALVTDAMREEEWRFNNSAGAAESFATLGRYIGEQLDQDVVGEQLAAASTPVLLVWGTEDKTVAPAVGERVRASIARSRLALIEGAAHTAYFEQPALFNAVLIDFLAGRTGEVRAPALRWM